jgi:thiamin-phosphate kinase
MKAQEKGGDEDPSPGGQLLTDIGEYAVHALLESIVNADGRRNIGDECAVIPVSGDSVLLVNIDRLASNVEPYNRALLCVTQTLSDIICMGGKPEAFLTALTLPRDTSVRMLANLTSGLESELARYGAKLVGGDTKEGSAFHMVGVGLGWAPADKLVRRVGALPGMLVGVTSAEGRAWGARWANAVIRELELDVPPDVAEFCRTADQFIRLPFRESQEIISCGFVRAGLDLSDGIGGGLRILARASNVGIDIDTKQLADLVDPRLEPVARAMDLPIECLALSPGYNWENMYVIEKSSLRLVSRAAERSGGKFSVVGAVRDTPGIGIDGRNIDISRLPADEKFARDYAWEDRFGAWRSNCRHILGRSY